MTELRRGIIIKKPFGMSLKPGRIQATILQVGKMQSNDPQLLGMAKDPKCDLVEFSDKKVESTTAKPKPVTKAAEKGGSNAK